MFAQDRLRNIAIIAHVDHGKTTLVDKLLQQAGTLDTRITFPERAMDSNDLERERGITILSKNTAITWRDWRINIVDTPGHADFGGEVERILSMVDSVLLLVDAVEGPMPQTRFVTQKAFAHNFIPIVVINKIDRDGARPDWVLDQTFELFDKLGATDEQLDFPVIYASALEGYAGTKPDVRSGDTQPLFETIVSHVPAPIVDALGPLQLLVSSLDYDPYVGVLGIGRITRGNVNTDNLIAIVSPGGSTRNGKLLELYGFEGLQRNKIDAAGAGDIVMFSGIEDLRISDTVCAREHPEALPTLQIDEPTISMTFQVNKSPFAGHEGKYLTSRQIRERLDQELKHNVALRVENTSDPDKFRVSGRGELHLRLDYRIPARGLIGFRTEYLTATAGTGLLDHVFDRYDDQAPGEIGQRKNGVMVSVVNGKALAYSLFNLQERGNLLIGHGEAVYEGMIVGVNKRKNDLPVNPTKGKQLTNIRAAGSDENIVLTPPLRYSLEQALEFIDDDELVEVTPASIRLRKKLLTEGERRRNARQRA